jgi:glycosyltransferase involved in cell wall biosynthesis
MNMRIVIVSTSVIPVKSYGGTERVIWYLGKELVKMGHDVTYLVNKGSYCDFAKVINIDTTKEISAQIPSGADIIHFNFTPPDIQKIKKPYVITIHGNCNDCSEFDRNTIFVSANHAKRFQSASYVYNGLDWSDYTSPSFSENRNYFHFLGDAAWRVKNVQGAIDVVYKTRKEKLKILGGYRFNLNMGFRLTLNLRTSFCGMVGGLKKDRLLNGSKGLISPVKWNEPFGLSIIESLYFGCPVFGTPYGSLTEIVNTDVGYLSNKADDLVNALENHHTYSAKTCHEYAVEKFNSEKMTRAYLEKYEKVLAKEVLNQNNPRLKERQKDKFLEWIK